MKAAVILACAGGLSWAAAATAAPLTDIVAITAAGDHTCALTNAGAVLCWGRNDFGQLGTGDTVSRSAPTAAPGLTSGIVSIEAGERHTCALAATGSAKCWGGNAVGVLGDGTTTDSLTPVDASTLGSGVSAISPGGIHTCAIAGGVLKCWGNNGSGALGDGTTDSRLQPGAVPGVGSVVDVSTGTAHTCALTSAGAVSCWGINVSGQLGWQPASGYLYSPVPGEAAGLSSGVTAISAGRSHSCAVMSGGGLKCWGNNSSYFPAAGSVSSGVSAVAAGGGHTCALIGDAVRCWGGNFSGQPLPSGATAIASGFSHSCALMADQTVRCWGANDYGQLGNGTSGPGTNTYTPFTVGFRASQDITFDAPGPQPIGASPLALAATASSGLPVSLSSSTPGVCTASGTTVTLVSLGICTLTAAQDGSSDFIAANPVVHTFLVTRGTPRSPSQLANISTRMQVQTGNDVLIGGFIIDGSASKTVVIRARGPSLAAFGVTNVLLDPKLKLVSAQHQVIASNDDWQAAAFQAAIIEAIGYAPSDARESALLVTLAPGAYTAVVESAPGVAGVGIVEIFEIDSDGSFPSNISTRGPVLTGQDVMIGGFVIEGGAPRTVVVRGRGPSLAPFGIANPLANPQLQLVRSADQSQVGANDDWGTAANAAALQATGFAPGEASESAILITLDPGAYTAVMSGVAGGTGVGIVEVFVVP